MDHQSSVLDMALPPWDFPSISDEISLPNIPSPSSSASTPSAGASSPKSGWSSADSNSPSQETPSSIWSNSDGFFSSVQINETPRVAIMGVGYVGYHLMTAFSKHYEVIAFDVNPKRVAAVAAQLPDGSDVYVTCDPSSLGSATHFLIAVPTPLIPGTTETDTSIIRSALTTIGAHVRPGATVIIESSVAVGTTRSLLSSMVKTHRIYAGMSPERVDPGRTDPPYESIPKIISGLDSVAPGSSKHIQSLYSRVFPNLVLVRSPEVAEMTKLYENCQRMICIAYANEMADACHELQIDPYEVSRAAATKPFGYLPFTPSAGVGGHCIPVNPSYLFSTSDFPLLKHATEKMAARPAMLADRLMHSLASFHQDSSPSGHLPKKHKKILVVGVAFKTGQELTTNSAGVGMIHRLLEQWDVHVTYADPLVREEALPYVPRLDHQKQWNRESLGEFDAVAVVIRQLGLDFTVLEALDGVLVQSFCP